MAENGFTDPHLKSISCIFLDFRSFKITTTCTYLCLIKWTRYRGKIEQNTLISRHWLDDVPCPCIYESLSILKFADLVLSSRVTFEFFSRYFSTIEFPVLYSLSYPQTIDRIIFRLSMFHKLELLKRWFIIIVYTISLLRERYDCF